MSCYQEEATENQTKFESEKQKMMQEIAQIHRSLDKEKGLLNLFSLLSTLVTG